LKIMPPVRKPIRNPVAASPAVRPSRRDRCRAAGERPVAIERGFGVVSFDMRAKGDARGAREDSTAETDGSQKVLLIIDDDELFCDTLTEYLGTKFLDVLKAHTGEAGLRVCSDRKVDVVLLDQNLPDAEGHTLCPSILKYNESTKIIFITAHPSFDSAVKALRAGAHDYLSKPFDLEQMLLAVQRALKTLALEKVARVESYRRTKESDRAVLIGSSPGLSQVRNLVEVASTAGSPVLITGETGTGKNVVATAIHYAGPARKEAFIGINCAALPENLIEAELFGYSKGAFTGAVASTRGIFEMAEGGTLFLDEIGEMPLHLQSKLLGALENKRIKRLGGDFFQPVDVRIISATSMDLDKAVGKTFRSDLFYRLNVIMIHIPPLRERREDIPELCTHILGTIPNGREVRIAEVEMQKLANYDWPGNVRELRNVLERALILQKGALLRPSELLGLGRGSAPAADAAARDAGEILALEEMEKRHIARTLEKLSGNYTQTARKLGISLSTLKRKLKTYGLI